MRLCAPRMTRTMRSREGGVSENENVRRGEHGVGVDRIPQTNHTTTTCNSIRLSPSLDGTPRRGYADMHGALMLLLLLRKEWGGESPAGPRLSSRRRLSVWCGLFFSFLSAATYTYENAARSLARSLSPRAFTHALRQKERCRWRARGRYARRTTWKSGRTRPCTGSCTG